MCISDWGSDVCSSDLDDRPAERAAPLLLLRLGLVEAAALGEVVARRQVLILVEHEGAAVELVGALLRHRVDPPARGLAEFRVRSKERSVGNECVSTCRSRGSPYH